MISGVHHIAIATFDIERLADFYCRAFGFEVVKQGGWGRDSERHERVTGLKGSAAKTWMLRRPNLFIELFEYSEPEPVKIADKRLCDPGFTHFGFAVQDIDAEYARLSALGMTFHGPPPGEPGDVTRALYGRDPDGNAIELLEFDPDADHVYHVGKLGLTSLP